MLKQTRQLQQQSSPYEKHSKRNKASTYAISFSLAKDMMPLSAVKWIGFRYLVNVLDQRYEMAGNIFRKLPFHSNCRTMLETRLKDIKYFATTSDLWSSCTSEPHLSLTIHYIDEEWTLQSTCLQTVFFLEDHTAEIICQGLEDALGSWWRSMCITRDNGAHIVKAVGLKGCSALVTG